jgi:hypothetical protein
VFGKRETPAAVALRAFDQGVRRPFDLLISMPSPLRARVAAILDVTLDRESKDPREEAWRILNANLKGLQARSHRPDRTFLPLRNHNWWEILLSTASRLGLSVYPGLSEREVERLVFDRTARALTDALEKAELEVLELVAREAPTFSDALDRLALSTEGRAMVLAALHRVAQASPPEPGSGDSASRRTAAYLRARVESGGLLYATSRALRFLRDALPLTTVAWEAIAVARETPHRSARPSALALATLHLYAVLSDVVEEAEALRL